MISTDKAAIHYRFEVEETIDVSVRLGDGSITVHAEPDRRSAEVDVVARDGRHETAEQVAVEFAGSSLSVHRPRSTGIFGLFGDTVRSRAVDVVLRVPAGTELRVVTLAADVTTYGRCGHTDVGSGSARIELAEVDGDLVLRTGAASCAVGEVTGSASVKSGSGAVRIARVHGALSGVWGSGTLEVGESAGPVRARTGAGTIRLGCVRGDVDLHSGSGGMEIGLPIGVTARFDARTGHGTVSSELPVEDSPADGSAPITIRARTGSGDVRVFRAR